jgi:hypothetical protein
LYFIYFNFLGEVKIKEGGSVGFDEYKDVKHFSLATNNAQLIYIYLPTLLKDNIPMGAIHSLKDINNLKSIDVVVFCSYTSDMNK